MHSIRFKITAITVIAIIITELCVFGVTLYTLQEENKLDSVQMMNLLAQETRKSLEEYIDSIEESVEMVSNIASDSIDRVLLVECRAAGGNSGKAHRTKEQQKRLDEYLEEYCDGIKGTFSSVANHTHGVVSYYYCINPEISETVHGFYFSRAGKTGFYERDSIDARELNEDDPDELDTWYFTPIRRGRPCWVGPYHHDLLGEMWICSYVVPVYDSGTLIGVLGMDIQTVTLISQVKSIKVYKTGFACLMDEDHIVLYHPERKFGTKFKLSDISESDSLFDSQDNGNELIRYMFNGQERQMSFTTLSNRMKLAIVAPVSEINAAWIKLAKNNLVATIIISIIIALIVSLIMRSITGPLLRLTDASRHLAEADYDVRIDYKGKDEVGVLTSSFIQMRDRIKEYMEDLNRRIYTDDMTGLPNTRSFFKLAEKEKLDLDKEGKKPVMLYFNMIGMKNYNRQYGYEEGNKLICEFADILAKHYKRCLSHLNQDHFAAVTDEEGLEDELIEIFREVQSANGGKSLPVHVGIYKASTGVTTVNTACDRAKYTCDKHRDSYFSAFYYFNKEMQIEAENVRYIINHLDQALSEGWIQVYYQPIIFAATGEMCDEEALSRWIDPERGFLPPDDFVPYLERAGLVYKLDLFVLEQVLKKIKYLEERGQKVVPISVNLSRTDFDACDIVDAVRRKVDEAGVDRDMITIEITESTIGSDFEFMKKQVERFQALGFPVWMDDFGSGYSSLDVLQDIRFDLIKLDMRFMHRFGESEKSKIIVRELLNMATGVGVDTICEGVETGEQVSFLRTNGCTKLQGFYYSEPKPFEEK